MITITTWSFFGIKKTTEYHKHVSEILSYAHLRDYQHSQCFDELGYRFRNTDDDSIYGYPVTVFTLRCTECGHVYSIQVDGHHDIKTMKPNILGLKDAPDR